MSQESLHVIKPDTLHMADDGTLKFYFSDVLTSKDDLTLLAWAQDIRDGRPEEINLDIVIDLPLLVREMLEYGYCGKLPDGKYHTEMNLKPAFDAVKKQLQDSLTLLDKIVYEKE